MYSTRTLKNAAYESVPVRRKLFVIIKNEREEFMQETHHTQQTATRTKPRQENNMNVNGYKNTEDTQKQTDIY